MVDHGGREGQQLGNYYLTHLLGQGSFADVYRADEARPDSPRQASDPWAVGKE